MELHGIWSRTGIVVRSNPIARRAMIGGIASKCRNRGSWRPTFANACTAHRLILVAVIGSTGPAEPAVAGPDGLQQPINAFCPVMTEENVVPEFTAALEGRVIGFCCDKCLKKFKANPSRYAGRLAGLELNSPPSAPNHFRGEKDVNHHASSREDEAHGDRAHVDNRRQNLTPEETIDHDHVDGERSDDSNGTHDPRHGHAHGMGFFGKVIGWLGKFHPPTANFPIAMILGAALAALMLIVTRQSFFMPAGRFCLWVGCIGAAAAAVLGWFFGGFHVVDESWILTTHRWLGTTTAAWSVPLLVVGDRTYRRADATRRRYRAMLFVGATLVGVSGFFGGSLLYGLNHYAF